MSLHKILSWDMFDKFLCGMGKSFDDTALHALVLQFTVSTQYSIHYLINIVIHQRFTTLKLLCTSLNAKHVDVIYYHLKTKKH